MKTEINLLPTPAQKARMGHIYNQRLGSLITILIVALLLILVSEIGSIFVLRESLRRIEMSDVVAGQQSKELRQEVNGYNQMLGEVKQRVEKQELWSEKAQSVLAAVPEQMFVSVLEGSADSSELTITAISASRAAGIVYERALNSLPWVGQVDAPLQNFALSATNEFTFTLHQKEVAP